jgi:hypothetical protein
MLWQYNRIYSIPPQPPIIETKKPEAFHNLLNTTIDDKLITFKPKNIKNIKIKQLNKVYKETQFNDSYRDLIAAINKLCPTQKQRHILLTWLELYRLVYNKTVAYIKKNQIFNFRNLFFHLTNCFIVLRFFKIFKFDSKFLISKILRL